MQRFITLLALVAAVSAIPTPVGTKGTCPLVTLKDKAACVGRRSECWSPGEHDADCPANGVCCFDGCVNTCGVAPVEAAAVPPTCPVEYVSQTENVEVEMCVNVDGPETCMTTTSQTCTSTCEIVDKPETVTEATECCSTVKNLVCNEKTCGGGKTIQTQKKIKTCKRQPRQCFNMPEQVCRDESVQECKPKETQECHLVKKAVEWPTVKEVCETKYTEKCSMTLKQICDPSYHKDFYKFEPAAQQGCRMIPHKECRQQPYTDCKKVESVTIEYEDVEECKTKVTQECFTKIVPRCEMVDREECIEEREVCEDSVVPQATYIADDCSVPERDCFFKEEVKCETKEEQVQKWVPERVCKDSCKPKTDRMCSKGAPKRECRMIPKVMTYEVPIKRC